ncbi:uncharacterized protein LOC129248528 [Anastrepha obliqua]|uniref:uncharacterized protein LOC129248528 n=1 Tax=Anastrepha obliqua TaxID=95512 RepID=UPI00240A65EB|nr:uncharacterized protein LOC129248528 [Anastrepha obliqua]XP_054744083.1 uncharacterized protein LOC129248528 [Anastrepha obliqua]
MKRLLFLALAITLLIKDTLSLPTPSETTSTYEVNEIEHGAVASVSPASPAATESESLSSRKRVSALAFKRYTNLLLFQLERTHHIAKDVLADPTITALSSEQMHGKIEILRKYVTQSDLAELKKVPPAKIPNRYYLAIGTIFVLGHFDSVVRELNATSEQDKSRSENLLWAALQRHGLQEYLVEVEKRGIELFESCVDDFEKYVKSLSSAERENDEVARRYVMYTQHPERLSKREFAGQLLDVILRDAAKAYE